jgi:hypothetical protein
MRRKCDLIRKPSGRLTHYITSSAVFQFRSNLILSAPLRDRQPLKCIKMVPRESTIAVIFRLITGKSSYRVFQVPCTPLAMVLGMYASFKHA